MLPTARQLSYDRTPWWTSNAMILTAARVCGSNGLLASKLGERRLRNFATTALPPLSNQTIQPHPLIMMKTAAERTAETYVDIPKWWVDNSYSAYNKYDVQVALNILRNKSRLKLKHRDAHIGSVDQMIYPPTSSSCAVPMQRGYSPDDPTHPPCACRTSM